MELQEKILVIIFIVLMLPLSATLYFSLEKKQNINAQLAAFSSASLANAVLPPKIINQNVALENLLPQKLQNPPAIIKAVYLTSWSVASKKYVDGYLSDIFKNTEINSVVIDIKDYSGYVSYLSQSPEVLKYKTSKDIIYDLPALIKKLHEKNIYAIARISTFEDPAFAKARPDLAVYDKLKTTDLKNPVLWQDNNHLNWLDPSSTEVQDYNISIAKDALANGFDEVNFDYIRFPSDGKTRNMELPIWDGKIPRHTVIKNFFEKIRKDLPDAVISADLFGQSTVNYDDLGIGQIIEDAFESFDYVCPMVYPSHYVSTFMGFENPADHPYEVVKYSMNTANLREIVYSKLIDKNKVLNNVVGQTTDSSGWTVTKTEHVVTEKPQEPAKKLAKIRPWLQDFNMGAIYTADMVKKQITATQDGLGANFAGYLMWNPSNIYKTGALIPAKKDTTNTTNTTITLP